MTVRRAAGKRAGGRVDRRAGAGVVASVALVAGLALPPAKAQDPAATEAETGRIQRFLESALSQPGRTVKIGAIDGILSSTISVSNITVADTKGPWLALDDLSVTWNRLALVRARLSVDVLRAGEVRLLRRPLPAPGTGDDTTGGGGLPVSVIIRSVDLPAIAISADAAGVDALVAATGALRLTGEAVSARIEATRLDGPGGQLAAEFSFDPDQATLLAAAQLSEPANGLAATALGLRGGPALGLDLDGRGPLENWQADLRLTADGRTVMDGRASIRRTDAGHRGTADVSARIGALVPQSYAFLATGESRLAVDALRGADGAWSIEQLDYDSSQTKISARGRLGADMFPLAGQVSLTLDGGGSLIALPGAEGQSVAQLAGLALDASLGGDEPAIWDARLGIDGVKAPVGAIGRIEVVAAGQANALSDRARRTSSFDLTVSARPIAATDPRLADLAGREVALVAAGRLGPGAGADITQSRLDAAALAARFAGTLKADAAEGTFQVSVNDLAGLAPLAGRDMGGALAASATGRVGFDGTAVDLKVEGRAEDARTGIATVDRLLSGLVSFAGGLRREADALAVMDITIDGDGFALSADGPLLPEPDLGANGKIADLGRLTPGSSGALTVNARLSGTMAAPNLVLEANAEEAILAGKPVRNLIAGFDGHLAGADTSSTARLRAELDGIAVTGGGELQTLAGGARRFKDLALRSGPNAVTGSLALDAKNRITGTLDVNAPDLATLAPLLLMTADGALAGTIRFATEDGAQLANVDARARNIAAGPVRVGGADIGLQARDLFGKPAIAGTLAGRDIVAGGLTLDRVDARAERADDGNRFAVTANGPDTEAAITGAVRPQSGGMTFALDRADLSRSGAALSLAAPTQINLAGGLARIDGMTFDAGRGQIRLAGVAGNRLDLTARMSDLPLSLANGFAPDLDADGQLSGQAHVRRTGEAPSVAFEGQVKRASVAASRAAGVPPVEITATGIYADAGVRLDARIGGVPDLAVNVAGTIGLQGAGAIDLAINGAAPLALAGQQLSARGASLSGSANLALALQGPRTAPRLTGTVTGHGGRFADPATGVVLSDMNFDLGLDGERVMVRRLTAQAGQAGSLTVTGEAGIAPGSGYPLEFAARLLDGTYSDGDLVRTGFDADLTISGPALAGPTIAGTIRLDRTDITIPARLAVGAASIDVRHRDAPAAVTRTLQVALPRSRPRATASAAAGAATANGPQLDIIVDAPARIFVRGRGVDAELGGNIVLRGRPGALAAVGGFELRRGRLDILKKRITLTRGNIGFEGDLDPRLDFAGTTTANEYTITVAVTGRASEPKIEFSSSPSLPPDEVLAQFIYGRSIDELSPVQLVQLAAAAAELGGLTSGPGLLGRLRETTGLDDLDVVTDQQGNPAVRAGRYVSDNIYLGVEQGAGSESSRVTIDLDIGANIKARGAVGADGDSSVGIYFEREY